MTQIDYVLLDPTGNMTILVETPVPVASQAFCATQLMAAEPSAEQVGFLSPGKDGCDLSLRMAGGEFCGNATLSAAALHCAKQASEGPVLVSVSGAPAPVAVEITALAAEQYAGAVDMPRPLEILPVLLDFGGRQFRLPLVRFDGISHLICTEAMEREFAESAIRDWCRRLGADALGLMLLDEATLRLDPLVYVPAADTLYWESSCASGSAAAGAFLAEKAGKSITAAFTEPGGILAVSRVPGAELTLRGQVCIVHRNQLFIRLP